MLMSFGVHYTNEESRIYGWGTENWIRLLKKVMKAAAKVPGGFQVDMTITGHWPSVLNTLDPNDAAANKELSFSVTPITAEDLASGTVRLKLPAQAGAGFGMSPVMFTPLNPEAYYNGLLGVRIIPYRFLQ